MGILEERKSGGNQDLCCIHIDFEIPIGYYRGHGKKAGGCLSGVLWGQAKDGYKHLEMVSLWMEFKSRSWMGSSKWKFHMEDTKGPGQARFAEGEKPKTTLGKSTVREVATPEKARSWNASEESILGRAAHCEEFLRSLHCAWLWVHPQTFPAADIIRANGPLKSQVQPIRLLSPQVWIKQRNLSMWRWNSVAI